MECLVDKTECMLCLQRDRVEQLLSDISGNLDSGRR